MYLETASKRLATKNSANIQNNVVFPIQFWTFAVVTIKGLEDRHAPMIDLGAIVCQSLLDG
jgi:hypothetical protein